MKVLVTGAAGFLGGRVIRGLLSNSGGAPEVSRVPDSDDRELRRDYADAGGPPFPPRQRRHPLLIVLIVLLILFVLLPVAGIALLFAVCAYSSW